MNLLKQLSLTLVAAFVSVAGWMSYSDHQGSDNYELISPAEVSEYRQQEYHLLDLRTPTEQNLGTVTPTAFTIDASADDLEAELASLNPELPYIVYDRNGKQIDDALYLFEQLEFENVKILEGGYQAWLAYTGR